MKKSKLMIIISLILIALGLVLGFSGYSMGASFNIVKDENGFHVYEEGGLEKETEILSNIKNIDISGSIEIVQIIKSDKYAVSTTSVKGKNEIKFTENNGELKAETINEKINSINISLGNKKATNILKIYVPGNNNLDTIKINTNNSHIELKGINANEISIKNRYGSIDMSDVKANSMDTELSNGNTIIKNIVSKNTNIQNFYGALNVENVQLENLNASLNNGDMDIKDTKVSKDTVLNNSHGSVTIKDCVLNTLKGDVSNGHIKIGNSNAENVELWNEYGSLISDEFISNKANIKTKNSAVNLIGKFLGDTKIKSNKGQIILTTRVEKNLYNYDISCNNGVIKVDGKGIEKELKENNNAKNNLNIENNNGNITLNFQ